MVHVDVGVDVGVDVDIYVDLAVDGALDYEGLFRILNHIMFIYGSCPCWC